ncbi:spore germination protein [Paenibacillus vulneris]|uniref:Spore germination protein n=1 Tax=Paenibacillus vulneris TaxID=1133364 RepID=A0ABW3V0I6_9BACL|nr:MULTISPECIES: spore germination protein [unclassified Paenibacillus]MBE1446490.1 spore germination protein PA/spore germination protein PF [Paenibacillus sp. OAS669]
MPSIVGNIKILSIDNGSIVHIGDAVQLAPESNSKTFAGGGSFNTGDFPVTGVGISSTNTNDNDVADSTQTNLGNRGVV